MDNLGEARLPFARTAVLPRWPLVMTSVLMPRSGHAVDGDAARPPLREVRGVVERITYQNPDNGYTVARLAPEPTPDSSPMTAGVTDDDRLMTLVGTLADLTPGEAIQPCAWIASPGVRSARVPTSVIRRSSSVTPAVIGLLSGVGSGARRATVYPLSGF